jgi:hypothetical protein
VLRRLLRVLVAAILVVLLAGVIIANDAGYRADLRAEELQACMRAYPYSFSFEDYSPAVFRFCYGGI